MSHSCIFLSVSVLVLCCCWGSVGLVGNSRLGHVPSTRTISSGLRLRGGSSIPEDGEEVSDGDDVQCNIFSPADVGAPGYPRPSIVMWGHGNDAKKPSLRSIVVPGTHDNISCAIADLQDEHEIQLCAGDHRWQDYLQLPQGVNITCHFQGETGTRLLGKWVLTADFIGYAEDDPPFLYAWSRGSFSNVICAFATDSDEYVEAMDHLQAVMIVMAGPWEFASCELRAASADILVCMLDSHVAADKCHIGGMGVPWNHNGTMSACTGVQCSDRSSVVLSGCTVEMCGNWGGSGLRCGDESTLTVTKCLVQANVIALAINDAASIVATQNSWKDNQFAHLLALSNSSYASLKWSDNKLWEGEGKYQGRLWASETRPGLCEEERNEFITVEVSEEPADGEYDPLEDYESIPSDEFETRPDLLRLDQMPDYIQYMNQQQRERDNDRSSGRH